MIRTHVLLQVLNGSPTLRTCVVDLVQGRSTMYKCMSSEIWHDTTCNDLFPQNVCHWPCETNQTAVKLFLVSIAIYHVFVTRYFYFLIEGCGQIMRVVDVLTAYTGSYWNICFMEVHLRNVNFFSILNLYWPLSSLTLWEILLTLFLNVVFVFIFVVFVLHVWGGKKT